MAAMKTPVGRLYMLFDACLPQNEKVKKRLNICKITESEEYTELKAYLPFFSQFEKYFSEDKLSEYSVEKLDEIARVIPKVIPSIENIADSIAYGNAVELTEKDIPDFSSEKSIDTLSDKLITNQVDSNITNITRDNFMNIFSDKTIKNPTEVLKTISVNNINNPVEAIRRNLAQTTYCIRERDITAICDEYKEQVSAVKDKLANIEKDKWKMRYKKWLCIGIAIIILTIISSFELMSSGTAAGLDLLSAMLLIIYFFIG